MVRDSRLPRSRFPATLCLFLLLVGGQAVGEPLVPLQIDVRARSLAPGEPVRIELRSPEELSTVGCSFLDEPVFMAQDGNAQRWSGWATISLDQEPGPVVIEAYGATAAGRESRGTHAVTIEPKEFPEEQLKVAPKFVTPPKEAQKRLKRERETLAAIYASRREVPPPREPFIRPVPGEETSVFGTRRIFNREPRAPHPGLDLRGAAGTSVKASGPGRVAMAQELYYSGNTVILDHGGGLFTLYAHLSKIEVQVGQDVETGDLVGLVGETGRVTGPHLHWGAKIGSRPFDPTALLDPHLFQLAPPLAYSDR